MKDKREKHIQTISSNAMADAIQKATLSAEETFRVPEYAGNRKLYDDPLMRNKIKKEFFNNNVMPQDPYTGKKLVLNQKEAKILYAEQWQQHAPETDHILPLHMVHGILKNKPFIKNSDIKDIANSRENLIAVSRTWNNLKKDNLNSQFMSNEAYLKKKGLVLSQEGRNKALEDEKVALNFMQEKVFEAEICNVLETGYMAGVDGAKVAIKVSGAICVITNIVELVMGKKTTKEAINSVFLNCGRSALYGFACSGTLAVIGHALCNNPSKLVKKLVGSSVPGKVLNVVVSVGQVLVAYASGEISTKECFEDLGEEAVAFSSAEIFMTMGKTMKMPIVGLAIGAYIGTCYATNYYYEIKNWMEYSEVRAYERQEIFRQYRYNLLELQEVYRELSNYKKYAIKNAEETGQAVERLRNAFCKGDSVHFRLEKENVAALYGVRLSKKSSYVELF